MNTGKLILMIGVAGVGKTTLAKPIASQLHCVYLDNNFIADAFFAETRDSSEYNRLRPCFYKALYRIAEENLALGNQVLIDAPHIKQMMEDAWQLWLEALVKRTKAELRIIRCHCDQNTLQERLAKRGEPRDAWKLAHWQKFMANEPIWIDIPFDHLDIDTSADKSENIPNIIGYIQT